MTARLIIRTAEQAMDYLASIDHAVTVDDGHVVQRKACGRCGGTGIYSSYHGQCYGCYGNRSSWTVRTPIVEYAKGVRKLELAKARKAAKAAERAATAEQRKLDGQRRWCEAQGHGPITFAELDAKRAAAKAAEVAEQAAKVAHVGTVGQRLQLTLTLEKLITYAPDVRLVRFLHIFSDQDGNRVVYWGDSPLSAPVPGAPHDGHSYMPEGYRCTMTAKVAKHGHYTPKAVRDVLAPRGGEAGIPETTIKNPRGVKPTDDYVWQEVAERLAAL